jgi:hypothetical protein
MWSGLGPVFSEPHNFPKKIDFLKNSSLLAFSAIPLNDKNAIKKKSRKFGEIFWF